MLDKSHGLPLLHGVVDNELGHALSHKMTSSVHLLLILGVDDELYNPISPLLPKIIFKNRLTEHLLVSNQIR